LKGGEDDTARGFVNIKGEEGVDEARTEVPQSIKDQYRLIEDPTWLENELLKQDDGYPTSRAAVLKQTLMTGDVKGFGYAVSSVQLTLVMFACAYVAGAASRVSGVEEGDLIYLVGVNLLALRLARRRQFLPRVRQVPGSRRGHVVTTKHVSVVYHSDALAL
jgi:hypothetical protein